MRKLLPVLLILCCNVVFAQTNKIEIYLVKNVVAQKGLQGYFKPTMQDLQPTPFISDAEIKGYAVRKDTIRMLRRIASAKDDLDDDTSELELPDKDTTTIPIVQESHVMTIDSLAAIRLFSLKPSLSIGVKFALVVNGKIIYGGYFWNLLSSFGCNWITAYAGGNQVMLLRKLPDYWPDTPANDPRQNPDLLACLRSTGRLAE